MIRRPCQNDPVWPLEYDRSAPSIGLVVLFQPLVFVFLVLIVIGSITASLISLGRARRRAKATVNTQLSFLQRNGAIWLGFLFAAVWGIVAMVVLISSSILCSLGDNAAQCVQAMSMYSLAFWIAPVLCLFGVGWIITWARKRSRSSQIEA